MNIDQLLPHITKPSQYCGNEHNAVKKDWDAVRVRVALAFPDLYEIGMSHQGLQILYHILNNDPDILAERVYAPDRDFEQLLRQKNQSIFSLESGRPLAEFDMLGITLPFELCYSNILTILDLAGIPLYSSRRNSAHPLIIGGGPCAFHPEPVADFFDAIVLGDGEEVVLEIAKCIENAKTVSLPRSELLTQLAAIAGVYIPSFFEPEYDNDRLIAIKPLKGSSSVRRAVLADLDGQAPIDKPLVSQTRIVHDRLALELARGCTRGCRFCQAGVIYRPVRERHPERVLECAQKGIDGGGFDELALLSLSTGDYSCLSPLLVRLMDNFSSQQVSVSMPSMRVGTLTSEIMEQIKRVRKTGFTIAPEAGTDRLRRVINKGITEEDLLDTVDTAFKLGWKLIKLYFMFGLPLETEEDLAAIPELVNKALQASGRGGGKAINVSVGTFVPKPHTPFQWEEQLGIDASFERIDYLKKRLPRGSKLKWNDPRTSYLEGVFSRGDRKLSHVIERAWVLGARLDAWSEVFQLDIWRRAAADCEIDLDDYLRKREFDEVLPWQHLDAGLDHDFYRNELEKAHNELYTPDCRVHGCQKCGLCDFKTVQPVVHSVDALTGHDCVQQSGKKDSHENKLYYWVSYERQGRGRFLGHLEMLQIFFRVLRRAGLPVAFSQGFNPSPKVSFSPALPVGTVSLCEYIIVEVTEKLKNLDQWHERLNEQMPQGFKVTGILLGSKKLPVRVATEYRIHLPRAVDAGIVELFMAREQHFIEVLRKRKKRRIDIRALVRALSLVDSRTIALTLVSEMSKAAVKPMELAGDLFELSPEEVFSSEIIKLTYKEL